MTETSLQPLYWVLGVIAVVLVAMVILKIYVESIKGKCTSKADLTGKTVIVTGANTGIGFCTAMDLARRNARVILACRDLNKGGEAVKKIEAATGNDNILVKKLDLSLMKSVREFAAGIMAEESRLNILVNNAAVAGLPLIRTEEGLETVMATNHFGPFLLTHLLLDLLKQSEKSRIVNVSSMVHKWLTDDEFDLTNLNAEKSFGRERYRFSKLANILSTRYLARKLAGTGVTTHTLHPGVVDTEVFRHQPLLHSIGLFFLRTFTFMKTPEEGAQTSIYCATPEEGAQTSIYCAVSEDLEGSSGKYYVDCKEAEDDSSDLSKDMGTAKKLWELTETFTGITNDETSP